jgi:desulfoferrodoxin (superoxide reductase-like protein)
MAWSMSQLVVPRVKANNSSMATLTVTCPAVEVATEPVSRALVQAASEYDRNAHKECRVHGAWVADSIEVYGCSARSTCAGGVFYTE